MATKDFPLEPVDGRPLLDDLDAWAETKAFVALCAVCERHVISGVGPPRMGSLDFRLDPDAPLTMLPMCLDCGADLIRWRAERAALFARDKARYV